MGSYVLVYIIITQLCLLFACLYISVQGLERSAQGFFRQFSAARYKEETTAG